MDESVVKAGPIDSVRWKREDSCCICFSTNILFAFDVILCDDITYEDVFYYCTRLEPETNSKSIKICAACKDELKNIYNFIKKAKIAWQRMHAQNDIDTKDVEDFQPEYLDEELIDEEVLDVIIEEQNCADEVLDELHDSNEDLDCKLSADDMCKEELYLETIHDGANYSVEEELEVEEVKELTKMIVDENSDFVCDLCGKMFKNQISKNQHMRNMHSSAVKLCDQCPLVFRTTNHLTRHRNLHHTDRKREYACKHCQMKFLSKGVCRQHEDTHNVKREKKYKCDQCEKAFYAMGGLNMHKRKHTGEGVQCKICEKHYTRLIDLQIHMRTHTNERPFECETCKKKFLIKSSLTIHTKKEHLGLKHQCKYCRKLFKDNKTLEQHKAEHTSFPFVCAICKRSFFQRHMLHRHIKKSHRKTANVDFKQFVIENPL